MSDNGIYWPICTLCLGIFPLDNLYFVGKIVLLVWNWDKVVNFGDILPETSKSSTCWDMGVNSHLTWLNNDSLYMPQRIEPELESTR